MTGQLEDKQAIVTGAGSGIGLGVARSFIAEGARVWLLGRHRENLQYAVDQLGDQAQVLVADVTDLAAMEAAIAMVPGRLDIMVANAAIQLIGADAPIADVPPEVWHTTVGINFTGTFHTLRVAVQRMLTQEPKAGSRGSIIVSGSPTGITGEGSQFAAYSATKAACHGLARSTAASYAGKGIRVNTVVPGHTLTPLVDIIRSDPEVARAVDAGIPMGRPGTVEECTGAYVYLASDASIYATGGMVFVDGGMSNL